MGFLKCFFYLLLTFLLLNIFPFPKKKVWADNNHNNVYYYNKYYHYDIDEQIRILEDKDYIRYLQDIEKKKASKDKARKKQTFIRQKEQLAYEKARRQQVILRRKIQAQQLDQERKGLEYEKELQKQKQQQIKLQRQYAKRKHRERQHLIKQQVSRRHRFYKTHPLLRQASERMNPTQKRF